MAWEPAVLVQPGWACAASADGIGGTGRIGEAEGGLPPSG
jgi:hypothetical protein